MTNAELQHKLNEIQHGLTLFRNYDFARQLEEISAEFSRRRKVLREALGHIKEYCSDGLTVDADTILEVVAAAFKKEEDDG